MIARYLSFFSRLFSYLCCHLAFPVYTLVNRHRLYTCTLSTKKQIAFIKIDALGDFVLWINSAQALSKHYSEFDRILLCSYQSLSLAESLGFFDKVIPIDTTRYCNDFIYRLKVYTILTNYKFECILQCNFSRLPWLHDDLVFSIQCTHKIAPLGDLLNSSPLLSAVSNKVYSRLVPNISSSINQLEKNHDFLNGLGINSILAKPSIPAHCIDNTINISNPYFIVFLGASAIYRRWEPYKFAAFAEYINRKTGWLPVLCGVDNEKELADVFIEYYKKNVINLVGKTSIRQFMGITSNASLLIGNDTSSVHISSAVDTPSIAVVGGGHFNHFLPYPSFLCGTSSPTVVNFDMTCYGCNWKCPYSDFTLGLSAPCIASISVEKAIQVFNELYESFHE